MFFFNLLSCCKRILVQFYGEEVGGNVQLRHLRPVQSAQMVKLQRLPTHCIVAKRKERLCNLKERIELSPVLLQLLLAPCLKDPHVHHVLSLTTLQLLLEILVDPTLVHCTPTTDGMNRVGARAAGN